ncbi:DUF3788 domain-containing protein [Clostridiaceae bacterium 35-E11]
MVERDLILDGNHVPSYDEILDYMNQPARILWQEMNSFIQQRYNTSPKITYSKCSGKPGWNVKYQKSGRSLCTLYPEQEGFVVLVVITLELMPVIEGISTEFHPSILEMIRTAKPLNGTVWLMIPVEDQVILDDVKQLLLLKHENKKRSSKCNA